MKENLLRARLPAGTLNDLDLAFLHEVAVLHDAIERFDLECRIQQAALLCGIERDAVMQPVDPQIGDIADPVADFGAKPIPELEIPLHVGGSHSDTMKLGDTCVTAREIAAAALRRAYDQIDTVAGAVSGQQRGLNIAKLTVMGGRPARDKADVAQSLLNFIQRLLVPDFDPDA
jgi:hypothetical protein